jgi:Do/DeqQ family serine protease
MSVTRTLISTAALTLAFAGGVVVSQAVDRSGAQEYDPTIDLRADPTRPTSLPQTRAASAALPDLSGIAERAVQASVNISSTRQVRVRDPFYEFYYGRNPVVPQTSLGSGVFVSNDGYVLTNSHVVQSQSAEIHVTTADNREVPAKIVGIDEYTDLAVLKVEAKNTPSIPWGDSDRLRVAEWVLAIGNPFQFNQTVTLGIVSAQNRRDPQGGYNDFIQTDAAINRGNSGGALINSRGELVGINTMIYSETGGYQGIGFAVPSNLARRVMGDLIKSGQVVRGWIGTLTLRTITAEQAQRAGLGNEGGVFVSNMFDDDPAYRAGLLPRDVIVRFNQTRVADQGELQRQIANAPIGSTATLEVVRRGERRTLRVPVVQFPSARSR